jgi:phosphoribosylamine--glycine ligase
VSVSDNFSDSKKNIIDNIERLNWPGGFYRKDIGYKVIK